MAPRPKQVYEEQEPDSTGTPFERFERTLKKVLSTPKESTQPQTDEKDTRASA